MKYSFYKDNVDKASGTVIALGGFSGDNETNNLPTPRSSISLNESGNVVLTQNTVRLLVNGSENWIEAYTTASGLYKCYRFIPAYAPFNVNSKAICSKYEYKRWVDGHYTKSESTFIGFAIAGYGICISLPIEVAPNVETLKTYLNNNQFEFEYQLATPIITHIPKSLVPTILTQATNTFTFGDAVAPSKVTIQAPVNRIAEMQAELDEIKALIQTPTNINLTMNYIEDEYNKNQSVEGEM